MQQFTQREKQIAFPGIVLGEAVRMLREGIKTILILVSAPGVCEHVECLYMMFMERYYWNVFFLINQ